MGPADLYLQWKRHNKAVGCVFARYMAARPDEFGQRLKVVKSSMPAQIAKRIDKLVSQFLADSTASAATLLFPDITELTTLVEVALALHQMPGWRVTRRALQNTPGGSMVAFGIEREIPIASGGRIPSEALVLGPFNEFAATRRAPVTALEIFVGTPPELDPKTKAMPQRANLAHVTIDAVPKTVHDKMWENSTNGRLASLEGVEDGRAKAKVAFVVPMALAQSLRCEP